MPRLSLVWKVSLLSLACLVILGTVLTVELRHRTEARALKYAGDSAALFSDVGLHPDLGYGGTLHVNRAQRASLDRLVRDGRDNNRLARVKIWDRSGRIVFSDRADEIGKRFKADDELREAFAGKRHISVTNGSGAEQVGERGLGPLLEAYVPLRMTPGAPPAGAFELYLPYAPVAAGVRQDTRAIIALLAGGLLVLWLALFKIVSGASRRLRHQARDARHQARHDDLTGLLNRRGLEERLGATLARAAHDDEPCGLLVVDLKGFKDLNDTLGAQAGDQLLTELGPRLTAAAPDRSVVGRLGSDQFAVILQPGADADTARHAADVLHACLERPFAVDGLHLAARASIGIAVFPDDAAAPVGLLRCADVALGEAKRTSAATCAYDRGYDSHSREGLALAADLPGAIAGGQLVLHYQPKLELAGGQISSVEALVRWQHPTRGLLFPDTFLPVAQRTGLMSALTACVLRTAVAQVRGWDQISLPLTVAVNVGPESLLDEAFPDAVAALLAEHGVGPERLVIELTESAVLSDPERAGGVLRRLRETGIRTSLDDFGTGYSSLAHLRELAVDELKVDRSFVLGSGASPRDAAILASTVHLARALGLRVVAEGVEDDQTLSHVRRLGCDAAQGYVLSRPVAPLELATWVLRRRLAAGRTVAA